MIRLPRSRARIASSALVVGAVLFAACGSDDASSDTSDPGATEVTTDDTATGDTATDGTAAETPVDRPTVDSLPTVPVTELAVTVIEPGSGPESVEGDSVVVDYTGVRSADGTEFDNSYDAGQPLTVGPLGASQTIEGFDQGLVGVQAGSTVQLDIPSALAYGDQAQGEVIQAGDDLTFLIEVRAVIPGTTADQAPDVTVEPTSGTTEVETTDLVVGTGAEAVDGSTVAVQYLAFSGADGAQVDSGWERGAPLVLTLGSSQYVEGFEEGITGMLVGGRRQVVIPGELAFGPEGDESLGIPAGADLIMVFDLLSVF
jgi:FKBP-type peptidyl-prolyl cis-trans isomerase